MNEKKFGALIIGQSPRPDLIAAFREYMPGVGILELGALDGLSGDEVPNEHGGRLPLSTRLRDGSRVIVDERFVESRLQDALDRLELTAGVVATGLLCAGSFHGLKGRKPLIKPFAIASVTLRELGLARIGVICPFKRQRTASEEKWVGAGFNPTVWVQSADGLRNGWLRERLSDAPDIEAVILDYVGHRSSTAPKLREGCGLPVLDLGHLAGALAGRIVNP